MNNTAYLSENQVLNKRSYPSLVGNIPLNGAFGHWKGDSEHYVVRKKDVIVSSLFGLMPAKNIEVAVRVCSQVECNVYNEIVELRGMGLNVWPSRKWIADRVGVSVSTVKRSLRSLVARGLLLRVSRGRFGRNDKRLRPRLNLVPSAILNSHELRRRLRGYLKCLMYFSVFMLASLSRGKDSLSHRNDPVVKETKYINIYKRVHMDNNNHGGRSKSPKKQQFIEIHGKKLQVRYVQTDDGATITSVLEGTSWMDIRQYHAQLRSSEVKRRAMAESARKAIRDFNESNERVETLEDLIRARAEAEANLFTCKISFAADIHRQTIKDLSAKIAALQEK